MASYTNLMTIARNSGFQDRIKYALEKASIDVIAEAVNTANHGARRAFAVKVLGGNVDLLSAATAVLSNLTIAAEADVATTPDYAIPDGDIQFSANSVFDSLAAV